jgi:enoyl-CoA hydratase/carnithine racemase
MLSSEWIDATAAHQMGLAWKVVPAVELAARTAAAANVLTALDPLSVAATKRLMTEGRQRDTRLAYDRELKAMHALLERH